MTQRSSYEAMVAAQRIAGQERSDGTLDMRELVRLATLAASSHNTQPWKFRLERRAVTIHPDFTRRCAVVDPDDAHLYKSLGCAAENLIHAAAAQAHVAHASFDPRANAARIVLEPSSSARANALFRAIPKRQCTKLPYDGRPIDFGAHAALEAAAGGQGVRAVLIDDRVTREAIVEYVQEGDRMQLDDPAFRAELTAWLRYNDAAAIRSGDGLASRTAGQPSVPDWLGRRIIRFLMTGKAQARTDAANIRSSPLIAVFVAREDGPHAWFETGRAYERFALQATALDIRTAFINQPIEVRPLRPQLHALLRLKEETALLMLRVGRGPQAPFSLRRPVDDVIVGD
jgi:hypothetical protein